MTISLSTDVITDPVFRVLTIDEFDTDLGNWTAQPMVEWPGVDGQKSGLEIVKFRRCVMPDIGDAIIRYHYGNINEVLYTEPGAAGLPIDGTAVGGDEWDPTTDTLSLPDILQHHVIIQKQTSDESGWEVVWWGRIYNQNDMCMPGALLPAGHVDFLCLEISQDWDTWLLNRHWYYYESGDTIPDTAGDGTVCHGNPGYNARGEGRLLGNMETDDVHSFGFSAHTRPGVGDLWSDLDVLEHAFASAEKPDDAPAFTIAGETDWLDEFYDVWEVSRNESVLSLIRRVCDRRRARGIVYLNWTVGSDTISPLITVAPQVYDDLEVSAFGDMGAVTIDGANSAGTAIDIDVIGDHRLGPGAMSGFRLADVENTMYDAVENIGEKIVVAVTLSSEDGTNGTLQYQSSSTLISAYDAADEEERKADANKYSEVYRAVTVPITWDFLVGDGSGTAQGSLTKCDYRCADDGSITTPSTSARLDTSPLVCNILDRLPLYTEYDYSGASPSRIDGNSESRDPQAMPPKVFFKSATSERWLDAHETYNVAITWGGDDGKTLRILRDEYDGSRWLESVGLDNIALTVAIELPHRVRLYSLRSGVTDPVRIKHVYHRGLDLHLVHPECVYGLDTDTGDETGYLPLRNCLTETTDPAVVKDDRPSLYREHMLAKLWYLKPRKTLILPLHICGVGSDTWDNGGTATAYPQLGEYVHYLTYSGRKEIVDTPITAIEYDHQTGVTTWTTSWADREG